MAKNIVCALESCSNPLPPKQRKYCSPKCANQAKVTRYRAR